MFEKILVANRGEIACRVIKSARRLGIRCVAVYSDADAEALHVSMADEAYRIGPPPAGESYLDIDAVLAAAKRSGAQAVHPGYGFLSENAAFARACEAAGIRFIGPPVRAISVMGSKSESKAIMAEAQVPLVPGYHGDDQSPERLRREAERIGYPVLLKASAGGGGRGMRVVTHAAELDDALAGARREAKGAFGDERMLIESYLAEPRHVEVQVFGDTHGNLIHLFERDCSAQRRHQKIIEEAPAPGVSEELRERMCAAAVAAARAIDYVGAGTVEFLLDRAGHYYFMEMNTRLQVEHPVTELITGEDLVHWQLLVAAGEPLPRRQSQLRIQGHAIEARLYAEDAGKRFMPSTGTLAHLRFPDRDPLVRVDAGVRSGDEISFYYDPMIAKVIAWGDSREKSAARLAQALRETEVVGVTTNAAFLANLVSHPQFVAGGIDTGFVIERLGELIEPAHPASDEALALGALRVLLDQEEAASQAARSSPDPYSPWHDGTMWRLNETGHTRLVFQAGDGGEQALRAARRSRSRYVLTLPGGREMTIAGRELEPGRIRSVVDGVCEDASVLRLGDTVTVLARGRRFELTFHDPARAAGEQEAAAGSLSAPMPGKVIAIKVESGQQVKRGTTVMVMEAMKMEHNIVAPADGVVEEIRYQVGDLVDEAAELVVITPA